MSIMAAPPAAKIMRMITTIMSMTVASMTATIRAMLTADRTATLTN
jgi:hypothetical protein